MAVIGLGAVKNGYTMSRRGAFSLFRPTYHLHIMTTGFGHEPEETSGKPRDYRISLLKTAKIHSYHYHLDGVEVQVP